MVTYFSYENARMNKILFFVIFLTVLISSPVFAGTGDTSYPELPYKEFVCPRGVIPSSHAPSIVELPDGELLAAWHASWVKKSAIWASRRPVGAANWTTPSIIHQTPGCGVKNPVLYMGADKKLWLFWADERRWLKFIKDAIRIKRSGDSGRTWDEPRDIGGLSWFLPKNHPIALNNGDILLPVYTDLSTTSAAAVSKDGGLTWQGPIYMLFLFGIQPTVIQRSDSSLFALMRTGMWPRMAWQAISEDFGRTWKKHKLSNVKNPGFAIEMIKLKSGNVVLAFNDSRKDRSSLSLALSYDEGRTWPHVRKIEDKSGSVYGYPSIMQDRNGLIHVLYSCNLRNGITHFVTDEKWLEAGK
jgi:predicted neuraminidase